MTQPFEVDGYRLIRHLGRGGTADVALAFVDSLNHEAAIKYPHKDVSNPTIDFQHLAQREHHLIGGARFPGLVRLLAEPHTEPDFLLMEFCSGPTLDQIGRVDDLAVAMNLISAIALDLEYLRARGIIHGDLKPQNIFLPAGWHKLARSTTFYAKISDFSLGRFCEEPEDSRAGLGTVGFMPPETIRDGETSHQSDLFALGMIAYQILTGEHPFSQGESDPAVINSKIQEEDPVPLEKHRNDLAAELVGLVYKLLDRDPRRRPESGLKVCESLSDIGATFDFRRALSPKYLIDGREEYETTTSRHLNLSSDLAARISRITCQDARALRCLMTANHIRGSLSYSQDGYSFPSGPIWPSRMRKQILCEFMKLPLSIKKNVIRSAVAGDIQRATALGMVTASELPEHVEPMTDLLRPMLRIATIRRLSARNGPQAEQAEQHGLATSLYIQAGMLNEAERCALQHATALIKENANDRALDCIRSVIDFASLTDSLFAVRELLMVRGDLYKSTGESERALQTYERIVALYEKHEPDKLLGEAFKDLGDVYRKREDFPNGLRVLERALKIYTSIGDQLEISRTLNNVGNLHSLNGDVTKALNTYRQAFAIQRRLDARHEAASTLMNIGVMYYATGRYRRCICLTQLSLKMKREVGNLAEIAQSLNNLGYVHHVIGEQTKAVEYLHEALEVNRKIGSKKEILYNLENLTEIMIAAGQLDKSLVFLKEGLDLAEALDDRPHLSAFHINVATVYMRMGRISEAESELQFGEDVAREISYKHLVLYATLQRAWIRHFLGNTDSALELARDTLKRAREANDIKNQSGALLLMTRLSDDNETVEQLHEVQENADNKRDNLVVRSNRVEFFLDHGINPEAIAAGNEIDPNLLVTIEDIESSRICTLMAEVMTLQSQFDGAVPLLAKAVRTAKVNGLRPEWATALTLQGQAAFQKGDFEQSYALYREALALWKAIAGSINNEADRSTFLRKRSIVFLTNEIRRLSSIFAKKKGQTNACPSHEV